MLFTPLLRYTFLNLSSSKNHYRHALTYTYQTQLKYNRKVSSEVCNEVGQSLKFVARGTNLGWFAWASLPPLADAITTSSAHRKHLSPLTAIDKWVFNSAICQQSFTTLQPYNISNSIHYTNSTSIQRDVSFS